MAFSVIRRCEGCDIELMSAPSSTAMIDGGGHPVCLQCANAVRMLMGEPFDAYELIPGSLEEVEATLGPEAAAQAKQLVEWLNRLSRRHSN